MVDTTIKRAAYVAKVHVELNGLLEDGVVIAGNAFAPVLLVKGDVTAEELAGTLLSGADGRALRSALSALGYAPEEWCAMASCTQDGTALDAKLLRMAVAALDPATMVICDNRAAETVREAYATELAELPSIEAALLTPGLVVQVAGMRLLNLGGFAEALTSGDAAKQRVWAFLKQIPPLGEPL